MAVPVAVRRSRSPRHAGDRSRGRAPGRDATATRQVPTVTAKSTTPTTATSPTSTYPPTHSPATAAASARTASRVPAIPAPLRHPAGHHLIADRRPPTADRRPPIADY
ncbi:hypothetical protein PUR57_37025 [Streptomyces sp. JV176]|uniref:hypothetical protein n=1 Tax=Streptomyces sp. JV176 TaxID=858630 RepID=UPI002E75C3FF|nr:hypothetical protein [Streptomyces sp. JV176]MEE1804217.1 hypothetical protein [Streptomyces sp. JV176]